MFKGTLQGREKEGKEVRERETKKNRVRETGKESVLRKRVGRREGERGGGMKKGQFRPVRAGCSDRESA